LVTQKQTGKALQVKKKMNLFWVIIAAVAAATPIDIVDYDGGPTQGEAWIVLTLHGDPTQLLVLQHVTWCKSFVPNDQSPPELALDCGGRNVMRLQLFPGAEEVVLKELPPSGGGGGEATSSAPVGLRFYIDPARVGGWDTRHQWNIYLEMSQRNGALYKQSVRFNPIKAAPTTTTTAAAAATTPPPPPPPLSPPLTPPSSPLPPPLTIGEGVGAEVVVVIHSWKGALIVLSVGSFLILSLVGLAKFLQASEQRRLAPLNLANQRSQMQARLYSGGSGSAYSFERSDEIEMTDFSRDNEEEEEDRLQKEDLQILEMIK
jgi:hypothetical protein